MRGTKSLSPALSLERELKKIEGDRGHLRAKHTSTLLNLD